MLEENLRWPLPPYSNSLYKLLCYTYRLLLFLNPSVISLFKLVYGLWYVG